MKVLKVLNNNVLISLDAEQTEIVVMGRGIGFQMKVGMDIPDDKIEKVFKLVSMNDNELDAQYRQLIENIPLDLLVAIEKIIELAESSLPAELHPSIRLSLADHIHFAIERLSLGHVVKNDLLWEIRRFYPEEYKVGARAIDLLNEFSGVKFPEDEAGFLALHFVNAQLQENMNNTLNLTNLISDIVQIIQANLDIKLDEDSIESHRLITHLKFFAHRVIQNKMISDTDDSLFMSIKDKYKEAYTCVEDISFYINKKLSHVMTSEEKMFLTIHVERVRRRDLISD